MEHSIGRKIVGMESVIATSSIGIGLMTGSTIGFPSKFWWVGVAVATATGVLSAAADRSRAGLWVAGVVGIAGIAALVVAATNNTLVPAIVPFVMVGLGVGSGCNRFLFGVVRSVPEPRRKRT